MVVFSSLKTIHTSCVEYVHPNELSCSRAAFFLSLDTARESFRIYAMAYLLALIMRKKIPSKEDLKKTVYGIIQSTMFLTTNGTMSFIYLCFLRWLLGGYNVLTSSFIPSYMASLTAIMVERPSRRGLLCLYVTNVASETLFRMAVWRNWVKPIKYGEILIFSISIAQLLYFFRGDHNSRDPIFGFIRFLVGPSEESGYKKSNKENKPPTPLSYSGDSVILKYYTSLYNRIKSVIHRIKMSPSHISCPHPYSCWYYVFGSGGKMFALGYLFQFCLKVFLQMRRIFKKPQTLSNIIFNVDTMRLGAMFASFNIIFKGVSCCLRRHLEADDKKISLPAGVLAGMSFMFFRENTIALYFMWKTCHLLYRKLIEKGYLSEIPWSTELFYAFATAILFYAALIEPLNLRPSYWRFLEAVSGNRIRTMPRKPLDAFGYNTSMHLEKVLEHQRRHKK